MRTTASYRSDSLAERIKDSLTMSEVARRYGYEPDRAGFLRCPFHSGDRTASLKIYPGRGGFHCYGCGAHGTVIDFVMQLFDLDFRQALLRLNADFGLGLTNTRPSRAEASKIALERAREARELEEYRREYQGRTVLYRAYWKALQAGEETPLYFMALEKLPQLDYWFDQHPWR